MQLVFGVVVCGKWDLTALKNTVHELLVANYHFKWGVRSKRLLKTKDNFWHPLAWTCKSNNKKKNCYVLIKVKGTLCSEERLWYLFRIYSLFVASCDFIQSIRYDGLLKTKNDFWHPLASLACTCELKYIVMAMSYRLRKCKTKRIFQQYSIHDSNWQ